MGRGLTVHISCINCRCNVNTFSPNVRKLKCKLHHQKVSLWGEEIQMSEGQTKLGTWAVHVFQQKITCKIGSVNPNSLIEAAPALVPGRSNPVETRTEFRPITFEEYGAPLGSSNGEVHSCSVRYRRVPIPVY